MKPKKQRGRLIRGLARTLRIFYRVVSLAALVALFALLYLSRYGVPDSALRMAERRAHAAGIPVSIEKITLTVHGWRAEHIQYGNPPASSDAALDVDQLYFRIGRCIGDDGVKGWGLDVDASGITLFPPAAWLEQAPAMSNLCYIARMDVSLSLYADRLVVTNGTVVWQGSQLNLNGIVLRAGKKTPKTSSPARVNSSPLSVIAGYLAKVRLGNGSTVDLDFTIDQSDLAASRLDLSARLGYMTICGGDFSQAELTGQYLNSVVRVDRVALFQGREATELEGEYNLKTGMVRGTLRNSITATNLLGLLPESIHDRLAKAELQLASLPRVEIELGQGLARDLPAHMSGTLAIDDVTYKGLVIESLRGDFADNGDRLEVTNMEGTVAGQPDQAARTGSCMQGGTAKGEAFWDASTRAFGIEIEAGFDPRLLVRPLSGIAIATNILQRFSFRDTAPSMHVALGASVTNWSSFAINIEVAATAATVLGNPLSSVDVTADYKQGRLVLDPLTAKQGDRYTTGSVAVAFHDSTVAFDVGSSMDPGGIETMIAPSLNLFGNTIKTSGGTHVAARGMFDWGSMQKSDFSAEIEVGRMETPVGVVEQFQGEIIGKGSTISLTNATFEPYGGSGRGSFSMAWAPGNAHLPYEADVAISEVDVQQCIQFFAPDKVTNVAGDLAAKLRMSADMSTNFFAAAEGVGQLEISDGTLAELPQLEGFSTVVRSIFPRFNLFSITRLKGDVSIADGLLSFEEFFFGGRLVSAKVWGRYMMVAGFDAHVEAHVLQDGVIGTLVEVATSPLTKLFEIRLTGPINELAWELEHFHSE